MLPWKQLFNMDGKIGNMKILIFGLLLSLVNNYVHAAEGDKNQGPLVSFGELKEVVLNNYSLRTVEDIEPDLLNPGGFLIGNQHSLASISPSLRVTILAGRENETAFRDGHGLSAYFNIVQDLTQINNGSDIIIADLNNHCIRNVSRRGGSPYVTTFAGRCGKQGHITEPVSARSGRFKYPFKVLYLEEENIFYYLIDNAIVKHNLTTDMLTTMYKDLRYFEHTYSFVMDTEKRFLYVNHARGLSKIDTWATPWERTLIAGTNNTSGTQRDIRDGSLLAARFGNFPAGLTWLIPDQVLMMCDYNNFAMRVINLEDRVVTTVCKGAVSNNPTFVAGGPKKCKVNKPLTVNVIDGMIYIGDSSGTESNRIGHLLTLSYSQPICGQPEIADSQVMSYSPVKEKYINNDFIRFTCVNGYGINGSSDTIRCVRAKYDNDTVYGVWNDTVPACVKYSVDTMKPSSGQAAGGTIVTLTGVFSEDMDITVDHGGSVSPSPVKFERKSLQSLTFEMPGNKRRQLHTARIKILFDGKEGNITSIQSYEYLPNPSVQNVSRTSSISSGGLLLKFCGENFQSAHNYTLVFRNSQGVFYSAITSTPEESRNELVFKTPDFSEHFEESRAKRQALDKIEHLTLTATLLSDGKEFGDKSEFPFTVYNSEPTFEDNTDKVPVQIDVDATPEVITLYGSNLNVSLLPTDYKVTFKFTEGSYLLSCRVIDLLRDRILCAPTDDQVDLPVSDTYNLVAKIQVSVANLEFTVAKAVFYRDREREPVTATTGRPAELVGIIVPVVIATVAVIVAVVIYIVYKRMHRQHPGISVGFVPGGPGDIGYDKDGGIELRLPFELRVQLDDMHVDPSKLSFNLRAEPIGRGHFGKVYLGQLQLKGNVLKTVAVKTLKETDDINLTQLQEFLEEATFMKGFSHANILVTLGVSWRKGDRPNVVLPYMALGDLGSLLRKPEMIFTNGDLVHFGMQVATGMEYLTANKRLHRDLAARNCLVDDTFLVKIADFGLSRDVYADSYYRENDQDRPRPVKWMALECLTDGYYNSATEVWSFGILMWELLTRGSSPYPGVANCEILKHLQQGYRLSRPINTAPALFEFMETCWDVDPDNRPTFTEIREVLEACILSASQQSATSGLADDDFKYSYARQHTRMLPDDYYNDDKYINDGEGVEYVDRRKIIDGYEQPVPITDSLSGDHSTHGIESLPPTKNLTNHYTQQETDKLGHVIRLGSPTSGKPPIPIPRASLEMTPSPESGLKFNNDKLDELTINMNDYIP